MRPTVLLTTLALALATPAWAQTTAIGGLEFDRTFAIATLPRMPVGAAYLAIHNPGPQDDRLLSVRSDAAERVEIHRNEIDAAGVARMVQITGGLPVAAGATVELAPSGTHLMLMGLDAPLAAGEDLALTLTFEIAGEIDLSLPILPVGSQSAPQAGHGSHSHGH